MCLHALDNRKAARCTFKDFSKAFDHIDHETVLRKMAKWNNDPVIELHVIYTCDKLKR
jgi:hypothetical protein